ncbi:MAG: four-carbon acid sugar kinase family protein, partial [Bacteriovorax sp.]|nr:four-carbon acid sugar kinase family protein [Rhizobacter sp.]
SGTDGQVHRLDRHPIMSAHPVTPMPEADLARHLAAQTAQQIVRFELPNFATDRLAMDDELERMVASAPDAILFDGATRGHLTEVGRLLEGLSRSNRPHSRPLFVVGSSGLEYAMTQWWRESGALAAVGAALTVDSQSFEAVPQVLAVSGSASPLSALQIDAAVAAGFVDLPVDARALVADSGWQDSLGGLTDQAIQALQQGHSVMLHTARGVHDPRIEALIAALVAGGLTRDQARHEGGRLLGRRLGQLVDTVLRAVPLRRLLLSGGDTSSQITQRLAPDALLIAARLAPGAPLCRVVSRERHLQQLQIALKGGQMGQADYFVKALRGTVQTGP